MKDLMDSSREQNMGPIESLKNYPRQVVQAKLQIQKMQEMEQLTSAQGHPNDINTLNKVIGMHPGFSSHMNTNQMGGGTPNSATTRTTVALSNYQNFLRQNSINLNSVNALRLDASPSFNSSNQTQALLFQGSPVPSTLGATLHNMSMNRGSSSHPSQSLNKQSQPTSQSNQHLQQHVIQKFLQEMMNTNNGGGGLQQPSLSGQKLNDSSTMCWPARATGNMMGFGNNQGSLSANAVGMVSTRNRSFKNV